MPDILTRLEMAVAENNSAVIINLVKGELMDAAGKTIFEIDEKTSGLIFGGVVSREFAYEQLERGNGNE